MARNQGRRARVRVPRPRLTQEQLIAAQVDRIINRRSETKVHGIKVEEAQWVISTSIPLTYDLSAVAAGNLGSARIGNEISPTRLRVHGFLYNTSTAASIRVRLMVIKTHMPYDLYDTGLTSTPDFYLDESNSPVSIGSCTTLGKFLYQVNTNKYQPVYERQFSVYADSNSTTPNRRFLIDIPLSEKIVFDKGNQGVDNQTTRYHLVLLGSNENFDDTTITAELSFVSQLYFKDL
jgi:hypothetical protein